MRVRFDQSAGMRERHEMRSDRQLFGGSGHSMSATGPSNQRRRPRSNALAGAKWRSDHKLDDKVEKQTTPTRDKSHTLSGLKHRSLDMPKAVNPSFPIDGLFGLIKPSGTTSMNLLDRLKPLFRESPLFVPEDEKRRAYIEARQRGRSQRGKSKLFKDPLKIGQGGTLDPLADGVLGDFSAACSLV